MRKEKSEKTFTTLSVEQQQAIRGWGGPKPPRTQLIKTPNRRQL